MYPEAIEICKQAIENYNAREWTGPDGAIALYIVGTEYLVTALTYKKDPKTLGLLKKKMSTYMDRVEQLKAAAAAPDVQPGGSSGSISGAAATALASARAERLELERAAGSGSGSGDSKGEQTL